MASTHEVQTKEKRSGNGVFIALIPWVLFTVVAQHGTLKLASVISLLCAVAISTPSIKAGRPKLLELGAVVAFTGFVVVAFAADPSVGAWVERYARGIAAALLAAIAFGSLAFTPFTEQYAREEVPQAEWSSPKFKSINRRLTTMWAAVFAAMVPFHVIAGLANTRITNIGLNWVVPILLVLWAIKYTSAITDAEVA